LQTLQLLVLHGRNEQWLELFAHRCRQYELMSSLGVVVVFHYDRECDRLQYVTE
jgi:hypothetical protein